MADMVDRSGLILTDWADNNAKMQAQMYLQAQRQQQQADYARQRAVEDAANAARQQYASGNIAGAQQTAAQGNAWDVWGSIDQTQKAQVAQQASNIGTAAYNMSRLPKGQQRLDYFSSFAPTLKSHGMSDVEIAQYANSGFLDNDDMLRGYADKAVGIKALWDADQKAIDDARDHRYKMEEDYAKPITAADGAVLTRGEDGSYSAVYTPGTKPMQEILTNEDGSHSYVNIPGTAGNTYTPATGSGGQRVMGWTPRGADGNSNASVDNKVGLIARGVGASADTPLSAQQFLSLDMTRLEGRAAGRNNPGNMKNTDGSWKQFNSPQEYQQAQRAWLQRRWNEGARTVRDAVEGRVVGRAPQAPGPRVSPDSGIQVQNLGGGRSGPLWVDEQRLINGQTINGQRNQKTGEFKALGGAAGKPQADNSNALADLNTTISTVDRIVKHPGLSSVVGVPGLTGGLLGGKVIPGTNAAGFVSLMKNFNANAYLAQIAKMKGLGALSDAEGQRLSAAIGSIDTGQSEEEFKSNMAIVRQGLIAARDRLSRRPAGSQQPQTRVVNGRTYVKVAGGWKAQ
ncbi:hypothetical protein [Sphingomonas rubra]|uniref:Uncharacterized protein n=1 Tax=Sphingomonas rubra TaxID=634430 RepID=A0A1I5UZI3_9SPHN|nr:hypothetical protein [Sphingomonas rubra]SFQ00572.1 hypothetical protein SAMN04488241_1216 [Sphingomonas rubra]